MTKPHRANEREEETRANTCSNVSNWHNETCGHPLLVCLVGERQVSLRHADWEFAKPLTEKK